MENNAKEFGLFIDGIRVDKKISREELIEGIMSLSQYKRYLRGISSIPNSKLVALADRLGLTIHELHFLFRDFNNDEYQRLLKLLNLILKRNFKKAYEEAMKFDIDMFILNYNKTFYEYCLLTIQHELKQISDVHVLDMYSRLIDYPACKDNESFNFIELTTLIHIATISAKLKNYEAADILYRILSHKQFTYSSSAESMALPSVYSTLAGILGQQDEYEKILEITSLGIKYCKEKESSNALSHLHYFNALAHFGLNHKDEALKSAERAFMVLYLEDNPSKFDMFKKSFERKFEMKLSDLITFYNNEK